MNIVEILKTANEVGAPWAVCVLISVALILLIKNNGKYNKMVVDTSQVLSKAVQTMEAHTVATNNLSHAVDTNFNPFSERMNEGLTRLGHSVDKFILKNDMQFKRLIEINKTNYLSTDLSLLLFRDKFFKHTMLKIKFIGKILKGNNLKEREQEIKQNIRTYFQTITNDSIRELSKYKSVVGDLGKIITDNVNLEKILDDVFSILFSDNAEKRKIFDIQMCLERYGTNLERIILEHGECNE